MLNIKSKTEFLNNRPLTNKEEEIRAGFRVLAEVIWEKYCQDRLQIKSTDKSPKFLTTEAVKKQL